MSIDNNNLYRQTFSRTQRNRRVARHNESEQADQAEDYKLFAEMYDQDVKLSSEIHKFNNVVHKNILALAEDNTAEDISQLLNNADTEEYLSSYVMIAKAWELIDSLDLKKDADEIYQAIITTDDENLWETLNKKITKYNKGEAYILVSGLLYRLKQYNLKSKFCLLLENKLSEFEQSDSSYIFLFIKSIKELVQNKSVNTKVVSSLVEVASGEVNFEGIRQVIEFVKQKCNNLYQNLVSTYMRICLQQLIFFDHNMEGKHKIHSLVKIEQYLILVHTLYDLLMKLQFKLASLNIKFNEDSSFNLLQIINLFENPFVAASSINMLLTNWKIYNPSEEQYNMLIKQLLEMITKLPNLTFKEGKKSKQMLSDGLRKVMGQYNANRVKAKEKMERNIFTSKQKVQTPEMI